MGDEYLGKAYTVISYIADQQYPWATRQVLVKDTVKCVGIGAILGWALRFGLGKCHYVRHLKSMGWGGLLGVGYSFYFTNMKVETWLARQQLGLPMLEDDCI